MSPGEEGATSSEGRAAARRPGGEKTVLGHRLRGRGATAAADAAMFAIGQGDPPGHAAAAGPGLRRGRQRPLSGHPAPRQGDHHARASWSAPSSPKPAGHVPVSAATLRWERSALRRSPSGTGYGPVRAGFPSPRSRGPPRPAPPRSTASSRPRVRHLRAGPEAGYAVVMMVGQGGPICVSGPSVPEIYKTLFGIRGQASPPWPRTSSSRRAPRPPPRGGCARTGPVASREARRPAADRVPVFTAPDLPARDCSRYPRDEEGWLMSVGYRPAPTPCRRPLAPLH